MSSHSQRQDSQPLRVPPQIPITGLRASKIWIFFTSKFFLTSKAGLSKHVGVLIGINANIPHNSIDTGMQDCVMVQLKISVPILVCCIYCAPVYSPYRWSLDQLNSLLNLIKATEREQGIQNLVIVGDINFSCTNWKSFSSKCEYEQSILDNFQELNLEQFIITDTGKSLDILLCNNPDIILDVYMDNRLKNDFTSDHPPYGSKLHMNHKINRERVPLPSQKYDFSGFAFKKANWNEINEYVREHHFNPYCYSNVDLQWYNWIYGIIVKHIPRTTQHRKHLAPWVSPTSSNLMKKVETLRRQS